MAPADHNHQSIGAALPTAMNKDFSRRHNRLHLAALVILAVGLLAALAVFLGAAGDGADAGNYQIVNGQAYAVDSSREMQQLERLGGKASVQTFKFQQWFGSLWQGRQLGYTLAVASLALALLCWHLAGLVDETP
jgi:hypothetical protein